MRKYIAQKDVVQMNPKWVVIYIAHGDDSAGAVNELLVREGFLCRINPIARGSANDSCYEVMALPTEAQEARDFLHENGY